jgi:hypothetical protein
MTPFTCSPSSSSVCGVCPVRRYRWMWIGDGAASLVGDGVQLALLVWTCIHFNEPFLQIGVGDCRQASAPYGFVIEPRDCWGSLLALVGSPACIRFSFGVNLKLGPVLIHVLRVEGGAQLTRP